MSSTSAGCGTAAPRPAVARVDMAAIVTAGSPARQRDGRSAGRRDSRSAAAGATVGYPVRAAVPSPGWPRVLEGLREGRSGCALPRRRRRSAWSPGPSRSPATGTTSSAEPAGPRARRERRRRGRLRLGQAAARRRAGGRQGRRAASHRVARGAAARSVPTRVPWVKKELRLEGERGGRGERRVPADPRRRRVDQADEALQTRARSPARSPRPT